MSAQIPTDELKDDAVDPNQDTVDDKLPPEEGQDPQEKEEEDVTKLDLTEPEHLTKFKASYQNYKSGYEESQSRIITLEEQIDNMLADQGKGVYLDTNMPLEDFKSTIKERLDQMAQEEPDYFNIAVEELLEPHFWPSVGERFKNEIDMQLSGEKEVDEEIAQQMEVAWDAMSRKIAGIDGRAVYGILQIVAQTPEIQNQIRQIASGEDPFKGGTYQPQTFPNQPDTRTAMGVQQSYMNQQPIQVETVEQISKRLNLDPSEEVHMNHIRSIIADQHSRRNQQLQMIQMQQAYENQIIQLRQQIDSVKSDQEKSNKISDEDLTKQAESRVSSLVEKSLNDDIQREYGNAVPADKKSLLSKLKTLAETRLSSDPNYQKARKTAISWFKQAASAKNPTDRDRWDQKGIDALAVMVPLRMKAIDTEAQELLGHIKKRADDRKKITTPRRPTEITQRGNPVPPRKESTPAAPGDMNAAKEAIRKRAQRIFQNR